MKIFLLSLLVLLALVKNTVAQTYTIPWAQQQPAWVFPLWFEDASGAKDTLYLCYDVNAGIIQPETFGSINFIDTVEHFKISFESPFNNDTWSSF